MALWNKILNRTKKVNEKSENSDGLVIENNILIKCDGSKGTVVIPQDFDAISRNAFDSCKDVTINYSGEYITKKLSDYILTELMLLNEDNHFVQFKEYGACLWVWRCDSMQIEEAIGTALDKIEGENPDDKWTLITIDANDINVINEQIKTLGHQNLVKVDNDKISTFLEMPFISSYPIQQFGAQSEEFNEIIEKEGLGVLYIKNLNENNYRDLPRNFIYSLNKHHSFCGVRLNPRWLVIVEVGSNVRLDTPGGVSMSFNAGIFMNLTVEDYMKWKNIVDLQADEEKEQSIPKSNSEVNEKSIKSRDTDDVKDKVDAEKGSEKKDGVAEPFKEIEEEKNKSIWKALNELGYDRGSDIPFFHFNECCEELNIDSDSIDVEKFCERYEVNIG